MVHRCTAEAAAVLGVTPWSTSKFKQLSTSCSRTKAEPRVTLLPSPPAPHLRLRGDELRLGLQPSVAQRIVGVRQPPVALLALLQARLLVGAQRLQLADLLGQLLVLGVGALQRALHLGSGVMDMCRVCMHCVEMFVVQAQQ